MNLARGLLTTLAFFSLCAPAYAGAWTQDKGSTQLIVSGSYYDAGKFYDTKGHTQSQTGYHKYELNPYLEYGLWDGLTVGANLALQRATQGSASNWGLGDSEFFARKRLYHNNGLIFSTQATIKLPAIAASDRLPKLGGSHPDAGLGLSTGYGFSAFGHNHYIDIDTQYRYRMGDQKDQIRVDATMGIEVAQRWMVMPQIFTTYRTSHTQNPAFTQSTADDYNLVRMQLSGVYKASDSTSLQAGAFMDVDGKNAGVGSGVLLGVWNHF